MTEFNILALVEAGHIKADDNTLPMMQGISREHAHSVAKWLVLATRSDVHLQLLDFNGGEDIHYTLAQVEASIKHVPLATGHNVITDEGTAPE